MNVFDSTRPTTPLTRSSIHGACSYPLNLQTIGELLDNAATENPDHQAFLFPEFNEKITYRQLQGKASTLSKAFLALELGRGDTATLIGYGGSDFITSVFALAQIGCVVNAPYLYQPYHLLLKEGLTRMECKALIICGDGDRKLFDIFKEIAGSISMDDAGNYSYENFPALKVVVVNGESDVVGATTFEALQVLGMPVSDSALKTAKSNVDMDDLVLVLSSTGTTGIPKLVALTHMNVTAECLLTCLRNYADVKTFVTASQSPLDDDIYPIIQSILNIMACKRSPQAVMLHTVDHSNLEKSVAKYLQVLQDFRVTSGWFYPHIWISMLLDFPNADQYDLSALKHGTCCGWRVSNDLNQRVQTQIPGFTIHYAANECAPMTIGFPADTSVTRRQTVGFVAPHMQIKVVDDDGKVVPIGCKGEICARGPTVFSHYWGQPELTRQVKDSNGWYHTGDIGIMDEEGFMTFIGRKSDAVRFKSWGDIVYPGYIEDTVNRHTRVKESKVIGVPHRIKGHTICLCIVLKNPETETLTIKEVEDFVTSKLSKKDIPDYVFFLPEIPKIGARKKVPIQKMVDMCKEKISQDEKSADELAARLVT